MSFTFKRTHGYVRLCMILFIILPFGVIKEVNGAEVVDRIVAVVNDDIIALFELNRAFKPYMERIRALGYPLEKERKMLFKVREEILSQLINEKLTDQEIKRTKITVDEAEVDAAIERIREASSQDIKDLQEILAREGLTTEDYRTQVKEQILRSKLVTLEVKSKIIITAQDVKIYYENHKEQYGGAETYHLRNIIMRVSPQASESEKQAVLKEMETVRARLDAGESFEAMARIYTESSLAADGGDLGFFKLNEISPVVQKAIKGLKSGQYTSILDTDQGYQIFYVEEVVNTTGKSFEEAAPEIEEKLYNEIVNEKFQSWLEDLRKKSHIKIIR